VYRYGWVRVYRFDAATPPVGLGDAVRFLGEDLQGASWDAETLRAALWTGETETGATWDNENLQGS
jgi:hypothetical protein